MPRVALPTPNPLDLSALKHQAKLLLKAFRAADPQALSRVAAQLPRFTQPQTSAASKQRAFQLADALCVVAREVGFASWPRLVVYANSLVDSASGASPEPERQKPARRLSPRMVRIAALADAILTMAERRDIDSLAQVCVPRGDLLAARELIVARDGLPTLVDALLVGIRHPQARVRFNCAHLLDHFADERCIEPLRLLLDDPTPRVRWMAAHVLSCEVCKLTPLETDDALTTKLIALALHDPSVAVRRHATIALGSLCGDARARQTLETLATQTADRVILRNARWGLRQHGI